MAGRLSVACVSLLAVLAFLLLFGSGTNVEAVTYKMGYGSELSCDGPDTTPGTVDDSCVEDPTYGPYGEGLNADIVSYFDVYTDRSMYSLLATMGTPSTWQISTDNQIPNGSYVGDVVAQSTLALFGGFCTSALEVRFHMYDCSTDIFEGVNDGCPSVSAPESGFDCDDHEDSDADTVVNDGCPAVDDPETGPECANDEDDDGDDKTISWNGAISGKNLTYGHEDGLPAGCLKYPLHVKDIVGNVQPRARYYGFTTVLPGMPPTQLQFMMFNPGELSGEPAGGTSSEDAPMADFTDDLGYINFTVLDNPNVPAASDSALDELCTPLGTTTNLLGLTGGEGVLDVDVFAPEEVPEAAGTFWNVGDACGDGVDNDANTRIDEMCGIVRVTNPAAGSGILGTGSHMAGGYSESYRDADGDTIANNADECPYDVDDGADADGDHIDDVCDPTHSPGTLADEDGDGWRNQADNCPLVFQTSQANDADDDNIGAACDTDDNVADGPYLNDLEWGSVCIEAADTDGDGWCDATEDLVGPGAEVLSDSAVTASVPEYTGIDWVVNAADNPPGAAPQSCDNWSYYDVNSSNPHGGVWPPTDDDGDTVVNAADLCSDDIDNDGDTMVNDGCPAVDIAEAGAECDDAVDAGEDDPADGVVNDGCPQVGDDSEAVVVEPNCAAIANDTDQDGEPDSSDNCVSVRNPSQLDTDSDGKGDACDPDDDADKINDDDEWVDGTDPKNVCDPRNFDITNDNVIDILDVLTFKDPLALDSRPCFPPDDYSICEATYRSDP